MAEPNSPLKRYNGPVDLSDSSRVSISDFVRKLNRCDLNGEQATQGLKGGHRGRTAIDTTISWTEFEEAMLTDVTRGTAPLHSDCNGVHQFDTIGDVAHEYDTSRTGETARNTKVEKCRHKLLKLAEKHLHDRMVPSLPGLTEANGGPRIRDVDDHCLADPAQGTKINSVTHQFRLVIKYCSERRAVPNTDLGYLDPGLLNGFERKSSSANDMLVVDFGESDLPLIPSGASDESKMCRLPNCVSPDDGSARTALEAQRFAEQCSAIVARLEGAGNGVESAGSRYEQRRRGGKNGLICLTLREMVFEVPEDVCNNPHQILAYLNGAFGKRESNTEIAGNILILESLRHHRDGSSQTMLCPGSGKCDCDIVSSALPKGFLVHTIPRRQKIEYVMHETRTIRQSPEELSPLPSPESVPIKSRVDTRETAAESELSSDETWKSSEQTFLSPREVAPFHNQKQTIYTFIQQHQDNIGASQRRSSLPANFKQFEYVPNRPRLTMDVAVQTDSEPGVGLLEAKHDKLSSVAWIAIRSKRSLDALNLTQVSGKRLAGSIASKCQISFEEEEKGLEDEYAFPGERECIDQVVPNSDKSSAECLADLNEGEAEMESAEVPGRMFDSPEEDEESQLVGTSIQVITSGERKWSDGAPVAAACGDISAGNVSEIFEYGDRDDIDPPNQQARSVFQWNEEKPSPSNAFPTASKRMRLRLGLSKRARPPPLHPIRYSQNPIKSKNIPRS